MKNSGFGHLAYRAGLQIKRLPNDEDGERQYRLIDRHTGAPLNDSQGPARFDGAEVLAECRMRLR